MNKIDTMIRTEGLRARMLLQIHDELIFEVDEDVAEEYAVRFVEAMEVFTYEFRSKPQCISETTGAS
jgi:DNA polymerase I-like protein with 3'-5' exonuclease and polymerase domains